MKKIMVFLFISTFFFACYATSLADQLIRGYGTPVTYWYWYAWQGGDGDFYNGGCQPGSFTQVTTSSFVYTYFNDHGYAPTPGNPAVSLRMLAYDADGGGYQHKFVPTTGTSGWAHRDNTGGSYYWEHWSKQTEGTNLEVNHYRYSGGSWSYIDGPHTVNYCVE